MKNSNLQVGEIPKEGSFVVSLVKNERLKTGWQLDPRFSKELHIKDLTEGGGAKPPCLNQGGLRPPRFKLTKTDKSLFWGRYYICQNK